MTTNLSEGVIEVSVVRESGIEVIDEARDYLGNEIRCEECRFRLLLLDGQCELKRACVQDRYARRIDRFFAWNPSLANGCVAHPYFEVRAVAAKHADVFQLRRLLEDPDDTVRWSAAQRLPARYLLPLRKDVSREVRIRVAMRLEGMDLVPLMQDEDYYVRMTVASRIVPYLLPFLVNDAEPEVRRVVAQRIGAEWLRPMSGDREASVRLVIAERLSPHQLPWLKPDSDWRVRYEVAGRIGPEYLIEMNQDEDPMVRERVAQRLRGGLNVETGESAQSQRGVKHEHQS